MFENRYTKIGKQKTKVFTNFKRESERFVACNYGKYFAERFKICQCRIFSF